MKKNKDLQSIIENLPPAPGVYIFRDNKDKPLYVGKAVNLKNRVSSYFHPSLTLGVKTKSMVGKIKKIEHLEVESEIEALILEADLIKRLQPYYNSQWRDDKRYKYIKIKNEKVKSKKEKGEIISEQFAKVTTTRKTDEEDACYFGPFPEGRTVNKVLSLLRRIFGFADCGKTKFRKYQKLGRGCLYSDLKLCPAPCAGQITTKDYQKQIRRLIAFLQGKKKLLLGNLEKEMKLAAKKKDFEQAAKLRDEIKQMEYVTQTFRDSSDYLKHPNLLEDQRQDELKTLLRELQTTNHQPPTSFRIEAYDISNISGKQATGSEVVFINGTPAKNEYRRYKIKIEGKPDDIAMMREISERRFKPKKRNHKPQTTNHKPNLILVDGGVGQLNVVQEVLRKYNLKIPVVALAKPAESAGKQPETLYAPTDSGIKEIFLDKNSPALKLLQRIRDEAHRFAVSYHRKLRKRELLS